MSTARFLVSLGFSAALYAQLPHSLVEPISGVVSLRELEHPISNEALRAAYEAQEFARAGDVPKAIAKLKKAIRINPAYRDAHWNLGVQYTRVGQMADACDEFQKALDIGPPAAGIYSNLALTSAAAGELGQATAFARKALELDPGNRAALVVLKDFPQ